MVGENKFEMSLLQATGEVLGGRKEPSSNESKLSKVCTVFFYLVGILLLNFSSFKMQVIQLTGFSDPVYAEAYVNVNQYDIVLDVLVVNQTSDTLQGLSLELATLGTCITCLCTSWIVFMLFLLFSCCI